MEDLNRRQLLIAAGATTVASGALAAPGLASGGGGDGGSGPRSCRRRRQLPLPAGVDDAADRSARRVDHEGAAEQLPGPAGQRGLGGATSSSSPARCASPTGTRPTGRSTTPCRARASWGSSTPDDQQSISVLEPGDIGFIPTGWAHYIRNVGTTDMIVFWFQQPADRHRALDDVRRDADEHVHADARRPAPRRDEPTETRFIV